MADIGHQLGYFGHRTVLLDDFSQLLDTERPSHSFAVMLDCDSTCLLDDAQLAALPKLSAQVPVVILASDGSLEKRLKAVRMGCQAFFTRPLNMSSLLDSLDRITAPPVAETGKVLIVDDSPSTAAFYAATLKAAGFVCQVVTDPLKSLDVLEDQQPELVLLDMHMPGANGEELAKVIRQQDAFLSTPIVFLSAESDVDRQRAAMSLGGDEFLQKPIEPNHLVSAVKSRIIRYRALRALMVRDSLTGLLNHTNFKERLRTEVARAKRQNKSLAVALIDIDFFKKVNDTYGHPAGDRVIKNLARLLKQRLRGADVIGRYGGEEFAVALPDTNLDGAIKALDNIRVSFEAIDQNAGGNSFHATLSAGVALFPSGQDAETLIKQADEALYAAKRGGRNRVESYQS